MILPLGGVLRRPLFGDYVGNNFGAFTTGDIGDEINYTELTQVKPRTFNFGNMGRISTVSPCAAAPAISAGPSAIS